MEDIVQNYLTDTRLTIENIYIQDGSITISPTTEKRIDELTAYKGVTDIVLFDIDAMKLNEEMIKIINVECTRLGHGTLSYASDLQRGVDVRADDLVDNPFLGKQVYSVQIVEKRVK